MLDHHGCPRASRLTSGKTSLGRHGTQSRGCAGQTVRSCSNACHGAPLWGATKMHGGGRSPPANRSLRLSNQSAASSKRKSENFEQRPALKIPRSKVPSSYNGRPETLRGKLTLGNVGGSHTQGNQLAETALVGWGGRTRTSEWRNQNPPILLEPSMLILKKTAKFGPLPINELALYSEWPRGSRRSSQGCQVASQSA